MPSNSWYRIRRHAPAATSQLTRPILADGIRDVIQCAVLSLIATVNDDGTPNVSLKESLLLRSDPAFFAYIASPQTSEHFLRNPTVSINVGDLFRRRGYRSNRPARVLHTREPGWTDVSEWDWRKNGADHPVNHVVRIDVSAALAVLSPAYCFGRAASEDALCEANMAIDRILKWDGIAP
ncbi:pyridoxamine 5'-phosphate oxidase family protein [Burkholderia sp. SCN-KJ]|uniref:pyridoxamine 5'-phosphate oxidase family protein n=1 Tax=Burkholderia sp. SCN-KJ TaxID=2969248 RepID=UPI00214F86ED|nr:pyridoxamine 5'-phosphate oxidase family protein [Burkholderia sp. SCN-KJ]MCR4470023.1 pyridoxamine 5'-phosphate oxidase family protein [Burkholderia sp. SCN-KJ]